MITPYLPTINGKKTSKNKEKLEYYCIRITIAIAFKSFMLTKSASHKYRPVQNF